MCIVITTLVGITNFHLQNKAQSNEQNKKNDKKLKQKKEKEKWKSEGNTIFARIHSKHIQLLELHFEWLCNSMVYAMQEI